jgi:hypothetical protein
MRTVKLWKLYQEEEREEGREREGRRKGGEVR